MDNWNGLTGRREPIVINCFRLLDMAKKWKCHRFLMPRYAFTVIRDVDSFPTLLQENLAKPSLSVIFTGDIDPATGKSW